MDGGANCSITNNQDLLTGYRNIKKYAIGGVSGDRPAIQCTGMGYLPWKADTSETVFVKCYYSKDTAETITSPMDIVVTHIANLRAWGQHCDIDSRQGWICLYYRLDEPPITFTLRNKSNLVQHHHRWLPLLSQPYLTNGPSSHTACIIRAFSSAFWAPGRMNTAYTTQACGSYANPN